MGRALCLARRGHELDATTPFLQNFNLTTEFRKMSSAQQASVQACHIWPLCCLLDQCTIGETCGAWPQCCRLQGCKPAWSQEASLASYVRRDHCYVAAPPCGHFMGIASSSSAGPSTSAGSTHTMARQPNDESPHLPLEASHSNNHPAKRRKIDHQKNNAENALQSSRNSPHADASSAAAAGLIALPDVPSRGEPRALAEEPNGRGKEQIEPTGNINRLVMGDKNANMEFEKAVRELIREAKRGRINVNSVPNIPGGNVNNVPKPVENVNNALNISSGNVNNVSNLPSDNVVSKPSGNVNNFPNIPGGNINNVPNIPGRNINGFDRCMNRLPRDNSNPNRQYVMIRFPIMPSDSSSDDSDDSDDDSAYESA